MPCRTLLQSWCGTWLLMATVSPSYPLPLNVRGLCCPHAPSSSKGGGGRGMPTTPLHPTQNITNITSPDGRAIFLFSLVKIKTKVLFFISLVCVSCEDLISSVELSQGYFLTFTLICSYRSLFDHKQFL